jgi:hypothetical protein
LSPHQLQRRRLIQALGAAIAVNSIAGCKQAADEPHLEKPRAQARGRFTSMAVAAQSKSLDIQSLLDQIDPARLTASVGTLAGMGTRWSYSPKLEQAEQWLHGEFASAGYPPENIHSVRFDLPLGGTAANVICLPERTDQGFLLVCAHYDSRSRKPHTDAPGADDNASGVAVMIEVARLMRAAFPAKPIMYVAFAGEEQGLIGSHALAKRALAEQWSIDLVLNLDMVGWVDPARPSTVTIEFDQGNMKPDNDQAAKVYGLELAQAAVDYTTLQVEHTDIWNSDYMPFEVIGVPCIGIYDGAADANFYHQRSDVPAVVSEQRLVEVTKILLAFAADFAPA